MAEPSIKAKLVVDTSAVSALAGGLGAGGGGSSSGGRDKFAKENAKSLSSIKGLLGKAGPIALGVAGGMVAFEALKGLMSTLVKASPKLAQSLAVLQKSLLIALRPFRSMF